MKINHDFHIHTSLSLCAKQSATLDNYIEQAKKLGLNKIGISNHFWDELFPVDIDFYQIQNFLHIENIKTEIERKKNCGLNIYFGCEAEYDPKRADISVSEAVAEQFEFILVPNSHTHMMMPKNLYEPYEKHRDFMIKAYKDIINSKVSKYITAIAHPFEAVCCPYDNEILIDMIPDDTFRRLFDKTAEKEIAVEINVYSMHKKTKKQIEDSAQIRMFSLAKECGCKFIFGSDAHDDKQHSSYNNASFVSDLLGISENDILDIAL